MIDKKRIQEAQSNFKQYLEEGMLKKERQDLAKQKYIDNADLSLKVANELMNSPSKPYLWIIVISYYSMFYIANAVLLHLGYKTQEKIVHKVTSDALIVLVLHRLTKELLEEYEKIRDDALEIARAQKRAGGERSEHARKLVLPIFCTERTLFFLVPLVSDQRSASPFLT